MKRESMNNNDVLRRLRYAVDLNDVALTEIFKLVGYNLKTEEIKAMLKKEEDEGYVELSNEMMMMFLEGFIIYKRGKLESKPGQPAPVRENINNNVIFKKLRIALSLKGDDIMEIMTLADKKVSSSEISAIFRQKDHRNYQNCGDKYIRNFLKGLTIKNRG